MTTKWLRQRAPAFWLVMGGALLTAVVYWPGLSGSWLFDDFPNIVDNSGIHSSNLSLASLVNAALSSPASQFKRPLASLSFAANYLATGLAPFSWKATNLAIHLLNGWLVFLLTRALLFSVAANAARDHAPSEETPSPTPGNSRRVGIVAALTSTSWMLLPINLTGVLYVVQRMESLANLFVLIGLLGYVVGRQRMIGGRRGPWLCISSVLMATVLGLLAKETAVMLPLYAFLIEWLVFRLASSRGLHEGRCEHRGLKWFFALALALPMSAGLAWLLPGLLKPSAWATRDFTLGTRLLSESRIVSDYVVWTLLPTPGALSFYHDDFRISTGLLSPWTTLASIAFLTALVTAAWMQRRRRPLVALGLALYLGCHLLTGTILPLELIYEHRNYFASFGLLLALIPLLAAPRGSAQTTATAQRELDRPNPFDLPLPLSLPRHIVLAGLMLLWTVETSQTATAWGNPLSLAQDLATRAPASPRAQYELGRTYIIYSRYDPLSPFVESAYSALEKAAALPNSSILPEQALIFMNARMGLSVKDSWWDSLIAKLSAHPAGVQDESSLGALTKCSREGACHLPQGRMMDAFRAAISHPDPSARLLATYSDYAWTVVGDHALGLSLIKRAISAAPAEPVYRTTVIRMLMASGKYDQARQALQKLEALNFGGRLNGSIAELRARLPPIERPHGCQ
ncbi:tetratricopeptide repeat protein [Dyella sp. KRB-257]|uniref:tetratricopeptide repeat protein n=1 Tax=Dyella sp. KRB-257 TaxID=3400915 RepID=UPI003C08AAEC